MSLSHEITLRAKEIFTDGYPMSIGELMNLYQDEELEIHPEFQRFYRWSIEQKSKLIESILLGIPVPPIFVAQREDGIWDVIDGLQRLSTIFEFVGILRDSEKKLLPSSRLVGTKYLPSLDGALWKKPHEELTLLDNEIDKAIQMDFKRSKLDIRIIKKQSDEDAKFELFQRLNTGGSQLSTQEVRNCILVMNDPEFYRWIRQLSDNEDFKETISLSDSMIERQYDLDLITRFLVFSSCDIDEIRQSSDLGDFLTEKILELLGDKTFEREEFQTKFCKTFKILNNFLGDSSFKKYYPEVDKFKGGFSVAAFECIALGLSFNLANFNISDLNDNVLLDLIKKIWSSQEFQKNSGSGSNAKQRVPMLIQFGKEIFGNE